MNEQPRRHRIRLAAVAIGTLAAVGVGAFATLLLIGTTASAPRAQSTTSRDAELATCEELIDHEIADEWREQGWFDGESEYTAKVKGSKGFFARKFLKYGGIVCAIGPEGSDSLAQYCFGPIGPDQQEFERQSAIADGAIETRVGRWRVYTSPLEEGSPYAPSVKAFTNGYWAYAVDRGAGQLIDQILENAPVASVSH